MPATVTQRVCTRPEASLIVSPHLDLLLSCHITSVMRCRNSTTAWAPNDSCGFDASIYTCMDIGLKIDQIMETQHPDHDVRPAHFEYLVASFFYPASTTVYSYLHQSCAPCHYNIRTLCPLGNGPKMGAAKRLSVSCRRWPLPHHAEMIPRAYQPDSQLGLQSNTCQLYLLPKSGTFVTTKNYYVKPDQ